MQLNRLHLEFEVFFFFLKSNNVLDKKNPSLVVCLLGLPWIELNKLIIKKEKIVHFNE